eukprot:6485993-Amphidinium_carterae.1
MNGHTVFPAWPRSASRRQVIELKTVEVKVKPSSEDSEWLHRAKYNSDGREPFCRTKTITATSDDLDLLLQLSRNSSLPPAG